MIGLNNKKADTPISISDSTSSDSLYCNICNIRLLRSDGGKYVCGKCGVNYNPEMDNVRHGTMIETLDGTVIAGQNMIDDVPRVAYSPEPNYSRRKKPEPKGGLAELARRGIKITSYTESDPK